MRAPDASSAPTTVPHIMAGAAQAGGGHAAIAIIIRGAARAIPRDERAIIGTIGAMNGSAAFASLIMSSRAELSESRADAEMAFRNSTSRTSADVGDTYNTTASNTPSK